MNSGFIIFWLYRCGLASREEIVHVSLKDLNKRAQVFLEMVYNRLKFYSNQIQHYTYIVYRIIYVR